MAAKPIDMTGKRYANATAIKVVGSNSSGGFVWQFSCSCGAIFDASGSEVRYGRIKSCPSCADKKNRAAVTSHGLITHPLYPVWSAMKRRCNNRKSEAYKYYGGRGIVVCERWSDSFANFLSDMGERPTQQHTLERENTNGNYEPGNCVWATVKTQANNKRNNRHITIDGETKTLAQWSDASGLGESVIRARLKSGISGAALIAPKSRCKPHIFSGEEKTLRQWAKTVGIKHATLVSRIYAYGWSIEKALTTGVSR